MYILVFIFILHLHVFTYLFKYLYLVYNIDLYIQQCKYTKITLERVGQWVEVFRLLSRHICLQLFFPEDLSFFTGKVSKFGSRDPWKMHFRDHNFLLQSMLFIVDKHHLSHEYYGLVIKYIKSHHPNWCMKVGNTPQGCLVVGSY